MEDGTILVNAFSLFDIFYKGFLGDCKKSGLSIIIHKTTYSSAEKIFVLSLRIKSLFSGLEPKLIITFTWV